MASNVELITGHGESDHISSFDMRAANRAIFGKGKYIFSDAENMATGISVNDLNFIIKSGSCMWSGMHIRIEGSKNVSFVSPATTDNVYIWLHYTRDASSLVESVEFVATTSNKANSTLIYDELPDDVAEAYTLFYSFAFNPNTNTVSSLKSEFTVVPGMNDFHTETTQKLNAQAAENAQQLMNLSNEVNEMINGFEGEIPAIALDGFKNPIKLGFKDATLSGETVYISLSEQPKNFSLILLKIYASSFYYIPVYINPSHGERQKFSYADNGSVLQVWSGNVYLLSSRADITISVTNYSKNSLGGLEIDDYIPSVTIEVYGIGRMAG